MMSNESSLITGCFKLIKTNLNILIFYAVNPGNFDANNQKGIRKILIVIFSLTVQIFKNIIIKNFYKNLFFE